VEATPGESARSAEAARAPRDECLGEASRGGFSLEPRLGEAFGEELCSCSAVLRAAVPPEALATEGVAPFAAFGVRMDRAHRSHSS